MEEDAPRTLAKHKKNRSSFTLNWRLSCDKDDGTDEDEDEDENENENENDKECDAEACETLSKSLKEVQSVLDQNRALIQQVNENHKSKVPNNLVKNVSLIKEIHGNISKVIGIYSDLSVNFSDIIQQRRAMTKNTRSNFDSVAVQKAIG